MRTLPLVSLSVLLFSYPVFAIEYNVAIDSAQEVPTPTLGGATPSGSATVSVNTITGDVSVSGSYADLTSNATAAHIHGLAPTGTAAGVLFGLNADAAQSGNLTGNGTLAGADLTGLLNGETYINVHTANNGPGEIRGQVVDSDIRVFNVAIDPAQGVPPPVLGGATPSGSATVVVDTSSGQVEISGVFSGLTGDVTAAHLHGLAAPGTAAGVLFGLDLNGTTSGSISGAGTLGATELSGLLAGQTYINLHTAANGPGEIRGQVPEPSSLVTALIGFGTLGLLRRRR